MKAKLIHLKEDVFKTLSKDAIDRGTNLKSLIEGILTRYANIINKNGNPNVASGSMDKKFPVKQPVEE